MNPPHDNIQKLEQNLKRLKLLRIINFSWIYLPTLVLFYSEVGLSIADILYLKIALSVSIAISEIPTGYMADKVGRKICLVLGGILWFVSLTTYLISPDFIPLLFADIFLGIGLSLISGADVAIAFDTFKELGKEEQFPKYERQLITYSAYSEAIGAIIGGLLVYINITLPFIIQLLLIALYIWLALTLQETKIHLSGEKFNIKQAIKLCTEKNSILRAIIYYSSVSAAGTLLIVWYSQAYMQSAHVPAVLFGVCWALFHILMGVASNYSHQLEKFVGVNRMLVLLPIFLTVFLLLLGIFVHPLGILAIIGIYIIRGIRTPTMRILINQHAPSSIRATVHSIHSFGSRIVFALVAPILAMTSNAWDLSTAFLVASVIFLILGAHSTFIVLMKK